ncbi:MAG: tetratricopeptide repeat protein [Spirochaetia bacterium]|nr:tetratricopeptide repeat protein [Spirochaetia bacterium]
MQIQNTFSKSLFYNLELIVAVSIFISAFFSQNIFSQSHSYHKVNKFKETIEGEKLYSQGKYDDAIAMFNEAIKKGETRGEPHYYIGAIHESRHHYEESIPYFQEAIRRELLPEFREATLWKLIILLRKQKSYADMITYIDQLEDLGIKHANLDKFREEAEINLSPEKIKARELINEAFKLISHWEADHENEDFWLVKNNYDLQNEVLEKYTQAVSMDDSLSEMYWEIAGYYEKMSNNNKAVQIYEKIIARNQAPKAHYKIGVIAKKNGNFEKAREHFLTAMKNLDENDSIRYYLLVNLSQVLYALADYENGIRYSGEAKENRKNEDILYDNLIYCLHLSGSKKESYISELNSKCTNFISKSVLIKKDIRFITLYHYMLGEVNMVILDKSRPNYKNKLHNNVENFSRALIPPELREISLKGVKINEISEGYENEKWASLPLWCMVRLEHVASYLQEMNANKELYLMLLIYKKYLFQNNPVLYYEELAEAAFHLGLNEESQNAYRQIKDRNFNQETGYLKTYLQSSAINDFQNEIIDFLKKHPEAKDQMKNFLAIEKEVQNIPHEKLNSDIKNLMGIDENPPQKEDTKPLEETVLPDNKEEIQQNHN